jgi:hypothetical protein
MTFSAFVAHRTIVRVVGHQQLDIAGAKGDRLRICDRNACAIRSRRHARHNDLTSGIVLVAKLLYGALATRADGMHRGVPAEVGQIESKLETDLQQVLPIFDLMRAIIDINNGHRLSPGTAMFSDVSAEILRETAQRALYRFDSTGRQGAEGAPERSNQLAKPFQFSEILWLAPPVLDFARQSCDPRQAFPARRTPAARFLGKKMREICDHPDRARRTIQHDQGASAEAATGPLH